MRDEGNTIFDSVVFSSLIPHPFRKFTRSEAELSIDNRDKLASRFSELESRPCQGSGKCRNPMPDSIGSPKYIQFSVLSHRSKDPQSLKQQCK